MEIPLNFSTYVKWSGILTLAFLVITVVSFIFQWGIRFRLVGATGLMAVLTGGILGLGLGFSPRTVVPGAVRYAVVYDNGANRAVVKVSPQIDEPAVNATLRQAADDLFSRGRSGLGRDRLTIRLRTVLHPEPGISVPLYLGKVERSLTKREDENMNVEVFRENLAQLPPAISTTEK